jgi:hypothetical protein
MSLSLSISCDDERAGVLFAEISAFDFGKVVQTFCRDNKVTRECAQDVLLELKRWLTLCVLHPENAYATGGQVDAMWHTFILFTKDYARFCQDIAGAFIHHCPEVESERGLDSDSVANEMLSNAKLLEADYVKYFGAQPPDHIWPSTGGVDTLDTAFRFLEKMSKPPPKDAT